MFVIARGACRDVYRIGESFVIKLCRHENDSNPQEVAALQATQHLPQTPRLFFHGECDIVIDSITLTVSCLLTSYGGPSLACLTQEHFALPFVLATANFFVAAYQDLAMMVIDGVAEHIAYTDVHTAKVTTVLEPTQHALAEQVPVVIVDTKAIELRVLDRHAFNVYLDMMFSDIVLQCAFAKHKS